MLCDICKQNNATVHLTQVIEGKTKKVDLCESCSKSKGIDDPTGFEFAEILMGMGDEGEEAAAPPPAPTVPEVRCAQCGFTQADFKKTGRLGCPACYETFAEGLDGLLKTMHKGTKHTGKSPQVLKQSQDLSERLKMLQKKLEKAIAEEDFETAVQLRDDITSVKNKLNELTIG